MKKQQNDTLRHQYHLSHGLDFHEKYIFGLGYDIGIELLSTSKTAVFEVLFCIKTIP